MLYIGLILCIICFVPLVWLPLAWLMPLPEETTRIWQHTLDAVLGNASVTTLWLALGVAAVAGSCGVGCAWLVSQYRFPGRSLLSWALVLPLAIPAYITAYAYNNLTMAASPLQLGFALPNMRNLAGAIIVIGLATAPYVYLLARTAFATQPSSWREVSQSLGYSHLAYFTKVALPAARPFWAMGITLAVMEAIADIGSVNILGVSTLASSVYRSWFLLDEPLIAARLAFLLMIVVLAAIFFERFERAQKRFSNFTRQDKHVRRLHGSRAMLALIVCAVPLLLGAVVPLAYLVWLNLHNQNALDWLRIAGFTYDSLRIALAVAVVSVTIAVWLHFTERLHGGFHRVGHILGYAGYAIPGVAVAVGVMLASRYVQELSHQSVIITGTFVGVVLACVIRFLATAMGSIHAGYERIPAVLDMAAQSLGAKPLRLLSRIHLPLLKLPIITAILVVVVDTLKELPATLILRPYDIKTLAIITYEYASDDRAVDAAPYALCLVALTSACMLLIYRLQNRMLKAHG